MNSQLGTWESIPPPSPQIPETPNFTTYFPRRSPAEKGISLPPQITRPTPHDFKTLALQRAKGMHVSSMPTDEYSNNDLQGEDDSRVDKEWNSSMSNCQHQSWPSSHSGTATSAPTLTHQLWKPEINLHRNTQHPQCHWGLFLMNEMWSMYLVLSFST
ncbi:hypothetical protein CROQUDRAFT_655158 [Cronartium quercuum f. sp. fusiforme G11]|uniref:Uncharacterized protein n=1 Tax=Cronartium quercuum f. sp. fusiforme G11 TaxID=708437 RepID=A0A9P6NME9_9BASI|nr:hypothetical protein CROQUDRAFT_655158 [Cronartium quercuum f. sp. fusiforme G11]